MQSFSCLFQCILRLQVSIRHQLIALPLKCEAWCVMEVTLAGIQIPDFWNIMQSIFGNTDPTQKGTESEYEAEEATSQTGADITRDMLPDVINITKEGDDLDTFLSPAYQHTKLDDTAYETSSIRCIVHLELATPVIPGCIGSPLDTGITLKCHPIWKVQEWIFYLCPFKGCTKDSQHWGTICSHVHKVHLGVCLLCHICSWKAWTGEAWERHMNNKHLGLDCCPADLPRHDQIPPEPSTSPVALFPCCNQVPPGLLLPLVAQLPHVVTSSISGLGPVDTQVHINQWEAECQQDCADCGTGKTKQMEMQEATSTKGGKGMEKDEKPCQSRRRWW